MKSPPEKKSILWVLVLIGFVFLYTGHSIAWAQEQQYLVAGYKNAWPNPAAIAAAGGTWVDQIPSIGVAIVKSSTPDFLTKIKKDRSVDLAAPDFEMSVPEEDRMGEEEALEMDTAVEGEDQLPQFEDQAVASIAPPSDPFYFLQWPHRIMDIQSARDRGITGAGVTIAVHGTGIDCTHPDLIRSDGTPVVIYSISFVPRACAEGETPPCFENPCDVGSGSVDNVDQTHETAVTGIIAAQCNTIGVCGIAPGTDIVNVKIFGKNEMRTAPMSRFLQAYDWTSSEGVARFGVRIINASQSISCDDTDPLCRDNLIHLLGIANRMVNLVYKRNVVMFASAGNSGLNVSQTPGSHHWPATDSPHTVPVGATGPCCAACNSNLSDDDYDQFSGFSNHGFPPEKPYIVMPAGNRPVSCAYPKPICQVGNLRLPCVAFDNIVTLTRKDASPAPGIRGYTSFGGTSAAAPHASGLAALLLSRLLAQDMDLTAGQIIDAMLGTGDIGLDLTVDLGAFGYDPFFGYGRGSAALIP